MLEEVSHEHVIAARVLLEVLHDLLDQIAGVTDRFLNVIRSWVETINHRRIFDWSTHHKKPQKPGHKRDYMVFVIVELRT